MYLYLVTVLLMLNIRNAVQQPRQARMSVYPVLTNYDESNATLWLNTFTTPTMKMPHVIRVSEVTSSSVITEEKVLDDTNLKNVTDKMSTLIPILRRSGIGKGKAVRRVKSTTSTTTLPTTITTTDSDEDYEDESEEENEKTVKPSSVSPLRNQILFHPRNKLIHHIGNKSTTRPIIAKRTTVKTTNANKFRYKPTSPTSSSPVSTVTSVSTKKSVNKNKFKPTVPMTVTRKAVTEAITTMRTSETESTTIIPTLPVGENAEGWSNVESAVEENNYYGRMSELEVEVADHWGDEANHWTDGAEQEVVVHGALS